jgi:extracellular elastinolytic metalloproteinase
MRMYIWTLSDPQRDGDLSDDVIAHEQTHGTTNRMTGVGLFNL